MKIYDGEKYDSILANHGIEKKPEEFNVKLLIVSLFGFQSYWFYYHKTYLAGIIIGFITALLSGLISGIVFGLGWIVVSIIMGIKGNEMVNLSIAKKVESLESKGHSSEMIRSKMQPSFIPCLVAFGIGFLISILLLLTIGLAFFSAFSGL